MIEDPGVYFGVPFDEYLAIKAVSNSILSSMQKSPAHCRWNADNPRPRSEAFIIGTALHAAVLEPLEFSEYYIPHRKLNRSRKADKEEWADLLSQYSEDRLIAQDKYDQIIAMRDSIFANIKAKALLDKISDVEVTGVWHDVETEELCKGRADAICKDLKLMLDIKTTGDASLYGFTKSIRQYGYHRQAAYYLSGFNKLGFDLKHFVILAIEKTPPYGCAMYRMSVDTINYGYDEVRGLLYKYSECRRADRWDGYPQEIQEINITGDY